MRSMHEQGASLERVGDKFGYTAGTVRKHLLIAGVMIRYMYGRGTVQKAQPDHRQFRDTWRLASFNLMARARGVAVSS